MQGIGQSKYVAASTTFAHDLPVFLALPCFELPGEDVRVHNVLHRGAVAGICIASTDLLLHIRPLPMEQLILHDMATVCSWPHGARGELFAVARRDIAVARRNLARLTHYVDLQDDHLAACDGALDDGIPLMTVEMFSRPTGGVQSVLDVADRPK